MSNKETISKARPLRCRVISAAMSKSRVGLVDRLEKHPTYGKYIKSRTRIMFHDESNKSKVGDEVLIKPSRPISRQKRFTLVEVVNADK